MHAYIYACLIYACSICAENVVAFTGNSKPFQYRLTITIQQFSYIIDRQF